MIDQLIKSLKKEKGYKNWIDQFTGYVHSKDRVSIPLKYYLVYDIDDRSYSIKSEYQTNFNMIVLKVATLPSKKDKAEIVIEDYKYG